LDHSYERRGLAHVVLSQIVGDSATVTSPLVPWNSCGAYMAATLGAPTLAFAGFSFFNLINPVVTVCFTHLGLRIIREPSSPGAAVGRLEGEAAIAHGGER
jgi:NhaC family Na+:H+ antiporter